MKINKYLLGIITGIIISCCSVVFAYSISSKDIAFTPTDTNWKATNVEEAINDLYEKEKTADEPLVLTYEPGSNSSGFTNFDMRINLAPLKNNYQYFKITKAEPIPEVASKCKNIFFNSKNDQTTGNISINTEYELSKYSRIFTGISGNNGCFYQVEIQYYN